MIIRESLDGLQIEWGDRGESRVIPLLTRDEYRDALECMKRCEDDPEGLAPYVCAAWVIRAAMQHRYSAETPSLLDVIETLGADGLAEVWDKLIDLSLLAFSDYPKLPQ